MKDRLWKKWRAEMRRTYAVVETLTSYRVVHVPTGVLYESFPKGGPHALEIAAASCDRVRAWNMRGKLNAERSKRLRWKTRRVY